MPLAGHLAVSLPCRHRLLVQWPGWPGVRIPLTNTHTMVLAAFDAGPPRDADELADALGLDDVVGALRDDIDRGGRRHHPLWATATARVSRY